MSTTDGLRLTAEQQKLYVEHEAWFERMTKRLIRRFGKWVPADRVEDIVVVTGMEHTARYDTTRGVPFTAFALKGIVYAVMAAARQAGNRVRLAYKACSSCSEVWLSDPKVIYGTDEERQAELEKLAGQAAAAMVVAGAFSKDIAMGGEDAMIAVVDGARVRAAAGRLSDRQQEVLERRYGEREETAEDIALGLGLGVITVRRAHGEALDELRSHFA